MNSFIGARLGGWRRSRNFTQVALAARAGLPQASVSIIEHGRRDISLRTVFRLAAALGITPGTLLDKDPPITALTRHEVDSIARAVVTGKRNIPSMHRRLADACAVAMRPTLEACGMPGMVRARRSGESAFNAAIQRFGREQVDLILDRVDRMAGAAAS